MKLFGDNPMPPIYCITLPEEPWKRRSAEEHFDNIGVLGSVRFVAGTQGVTIGLKPTNPYEYDAHGASLFFHPSQLGCVLSHRTALSTALATSDTDFIICEDDILLDSRISSKWREWRDSLPNDADVIQLEHYPSTDRTLTPVTHAVSTCAPYPFRAGCIWWTRDAASLALSLLRPIDRPYDTMLIQRVFPFLGHYVATPSLARQRTLELDPLSSIHGAPNDDHRNLG